MKKSRADNNSVFDAHRQNFIGKVFTLSRYQVVVEDVIAEGLLFSMSPGLTFGLQFARSPGPKVTQPDTNPNANPNSDSIPVPNTNPIPNPNLT